MSRVFCLYCSYHFTNFLWVARNKIGVELRILLVFFTAYTWRLLLRQYRFSEALVAEKKPKARWRPRYNSIPPQRLPLILQPQPQPHPLKRKGEINLEIQVSISLYNYISSFVSFFFLSVDKFQKRNPKFMYWFFGVMKWICVSSVWLLIINFCP